MHGHSRRVAAASRRGITLFEVVLALAIFVGAYAVINQVLETGSRAAIRSQVSAEAIFIAERKMNEMLSGIIALQTASEASVEGDSTGRWKWSATVAESGITGLLRIEVTVRNTAPWPQLETRTLTRYMRDPAYLTQLESAAAQAAALAAEEAAAATGTM